MAKNSTSDSSEKRDAAQKSLGFIGLSALAHVGVLISVLLAPSFKAASGVPTGAQAGEELTYAGTSVADPAALGTEAPASSAPTEVLLADANDANAVSLPATEAPAISEKSVQKTPKAAAAAVEPAPAIKTTTESEVAIQQALESARATQKLAKNDELPQQLEPPQMDEPTEAAAEPEPVAALEPIKEQVNAEPIAETEAAQPVETKAEPKSEAALETKAEETSSPAASIAAAPTAATAASTAAAPTAAAPGSGGASGTGSAALTAPNANGQGTLGASGGGGAKGTFGIPQGSEIRDARELSALPGNPKPAYPVPDKLAGRQGTTVLVGMVKPNGAVTNVMVEQSSGSRLMDQAAAQAFSKWKFQPGQSGYIRSPFQFQLVGSAQEIPARLRTQ